MENNLRFDYIPFKKGEMVKKDLGGYYDTVGGYNWGLHRAKQEAYQLCALYNYSQVSIEHNGVIVAVVKP